MKHDSFFDKSIQINPFDLSLENDMIIKNEKSEKKTNTKTNTKTQKGDQNPPQIKQEFNLFNMLFS
jgi:hypothetical protein